MSLSGIPDDALIAELTEHPSENMALEELTRRMRPIIMTESLKYRSTLPYDSDDYLQIRRILLWKIEASKVQSDANTRCSQRAAAFGLALPIR